MAVADAASAVLVQTADSDTPSSQIVYHITSESAPGLGLRSSGGPVTELGHGSFVHSGGRECRQGGVCASGWRGPHRGPARPNGQ